VRLLLVLVSLLVLRVPAENSMRLVVDLVRLVLVLVLVGAVEVEKL
jgi:hypothetical protein